jgi:hypothetical protein
MFADREPAALSANVFLILFPILKPLALQLKKVAHPHVVA